MARIIKVYPFSQLVFSPFFQSSFTSVYKDDQHISTVYNLAITFHTICITGQFFVRKLINFYFIKKNYVMCVTLLHHWCSKYFEVLCFVYF